MVLLADQLGRLGSNLACTPKAIFPNGSEQRFQIPSFPAGILRTWGQRRAIDWPWVQHWLSDELEMIYLSPVEILVLLI
jgi:hypothetical protein